jgi:sugar phosphate isomerase/epimerase
MITRRTFLKGTAAGIAGAAVASKVVRAEEGKAVPKIRVSSCSVGFDDGKKAGLEGVEIGVGGAAEKLRIADPQFREEQKKKMQETGLVVSSFMMGLFNSEPLASDPRGPAWLEQSIEGAKDLKAQVILVAFFGKGSLFEGRKVKTADVDKVVERLKAAAPKAKEAGVILGIENTLDAKQNAEILDRIGSPAVKIYYDCYNLQGQGYDVPAEIRFLKDRIAIFHFKNGGDYLDNGKLKFEPIAEAIKEIGYKGWIVLETSHPSKNAAADTKRNADYVRKLFGVGV